MGTNRTPLEAAAHALIDHLIGFSATPEARDLAERLEDAAVRSEAARLSTPRLLEVTGNIEERELAARYMEAKARSAQAHGNHNPRVNKDEYDHIAACFIAAAAEFRSGLHLPEVHLDGRVIPYNEDNETGIKHAPAIGLLVSDIHARNVKAGWWHDLDTGEPKARNDGEIFMLIVSEVAEAMEGHRKGLQDDKLPHRTMVEVEMADAVIRIADYCGGRGLDLGGAIDEKLAYNAKREDHQIANRLLEGGKKY